MYASIQASLDMRQKDNDDDDDDDNDDDDDDDDDDNNNKVNLPPSTNANAEYTK